MKEIVFIVNEGNIFINIIIKDCTKSEANHIVELLKSWRPEDSKRLNIWIHEDKPQLKFGFKSRKEFDEFLDRKNLEGWLNEKFKP